jgi:hypothetical protein
MKEIIKPIKVVPNAVKLKKTECSNAAYYIIKLFAILIFAIAPWIGINDLLTFDVSKDQISKELYMPMDYGNHFV